MDEENHDDFGLLARRRGHSWSCRSTAFKTHPSLALVKFWQGRVELGLRLFGLVISISALVSSVLSLLSLNFPTTGEELIDSGRTEAHKVMVCVVSTATVASLSQLVIIVCRFLNFHFASSHSSLMHVLDVIFSVMVTSAYFTETIPLVVFSRDLAKNQKTFSQYDPSIHFSQIRTKYFYSIGFCCCGVLCFFLLSVWMSVYLSFSWDRKFERQLQREQERRLNEQRSANEQGTVN